VAIPCGYTNLPVVCNPYVPHWVTNGIGLSAQADSIIMLDNTSTIIPTSVREALNYGKVIKYQEDLLSEKLL